MRDDEELTPVGRKEGMEAGSRKTLLRISAESAGLCSAA